MEQKRLCWLPADAPPEAFPEVGQALSEPNGLLAVGGDLSPERLLYAYRQGIFPWFNAPPIAWWSPQPRMVLFPQRLHISRRLRRRLRSQPWRLRCNTAFVRVMHSCAAPRTDHRGTWITADMIAAYTRLHERGCAHSVEVWDGARLIGGIYGIALGKAFFGESMFSRVKDTSKAALIHLCNAGFDLIDCQIHSDHLQRMGAELIPREAFCALLRVLCDAPRATSFSAG